MTTPKHIRDQEVLTSSPGEIVVKLYERMAVDLRWSQRHMESANAAREEGDIEAFSKQIEAKGSTLAHAADIVLELRGNLDFEQGGQIAENLQNLYDYFLGELRAIDRDNDLARLASLTQMVDTLGQAWRDAVEATAS